MSSTATARYSVKPGDQVTLKVNIGYGQQGVTTVRLDGVRLVDEKPGDFDLTLNPDGASLERKKLRCSTLVTDCQGATNLTGVIYKLTGGARDIEQKLETEVAENGDSEWYTLEVRLY